MATQKSTHPRAQSSVKFSATTRRVPRASAPAAPSAKPRTKATSKAKTDAPTAKMVIDQVCRLMWGIDQRLEEASAIGERSDLGGRLIRIAEEHLITKFYAALAPEAFSDTTVRSAREVLRDLEGAITGVEALHPRDGRGSIMRGVVARIDEVDELLSRGNFWPFEPQISHKHVDQLRADFELGLGIANAMMSEGYVACKAGDAEALHEHREGRAQNRFAKMYLQRLIDEPEALDGFAAALSAGFAIFGDIMAPGALSDVPIAEFEAGATGADGTATDEPGEHRDALAPAAEREPIAAREAAEQDKDDTPFARRRLALNANYEISKLAGATKKLLDGDESWPVFNGIMGRIELLSDLVYHVMRLEGESDKEVGSPPLRTLQAWYEGRPE